MYGATIPTLFVRWGVALFESESMGYPSDWAASIIFLRVSGLTWWRPRNARDTVAIETPERAAISLIPATLAPIWLRL